MPNIQGGYNGMVLHIPTSRAPTILRHTTKTTVIALGIHVTEIHMPILIRHSTKGWVPLKT